MIHRIVLGLAALAALAIPTLASAADLAEYPVMVEPECAAYGGRPYDDVWQPPRTAYIVASRCSSQLDMAFLLNRREKILVYYNGGSLHKTDIDLLVVPHSGRLPQSLMTDKAKQEAAAAQRHFFAQFGTNIAVAFVLLSVSLGMGTAGYHHYAGMEWIDAFANAAMMVTSMGPLDSLTDDSARLFGAFFALYSGLALAATTGLIIAPIVHSFVGRLRVRGTSE